MARSSPLLALLCTLIALSIVAAQPFSTCWNGAQPCRYNTQCCASFLTHVQATRTALHARTIPTTSTSPLSCVAALNPSKVWTLSLLHASHCAVGTDDTFRASGHRLSGLCGAGRHSAIPRYLADATTRSFAHFSQLYATFHAPELVKPPSDMCCYSAAQLETIVTVMKNYNWSTIYNITYDEITCNIDHDNISAHAPHPDLLADALPLAAIYITAKPNDAGQAALFQWANGLQTAIAAAGVPITHPRVQDFHMYELPMLL